VRCYPPKLCVHGVVPRKAPPYPPSPTKCGCVLVSLARENMHLIPRAPCSALQAVRLLMPVLARPFPSVLFGRPGKVHAATRAIDSLP